MSNLPQYRSRLGDGGLTCYEPTQPRRRSDATGCAFVAAILVVVLATVVMGFLIPNFFRTIAWLGHAYEAVR